MGLPGLVRPTSADGPGAAQPVRSRTLRDPLLHHTLHTLFYKRGRTESHRKRDLRSIWSIASLNGTVRKGIQEAEAQSPKTPSLCPEKQCLYRVPSSQPQDGQAGPRARCAPRRAPGPRREGSVLGWGETSRPGPGPHAGVRGNTAPSQPSLPTCEPPTFLSQCK